MDNFITGWIDIYEIAKVWFYLIANKYTFSNYADFWYMCFNGESTSTYWDWFPEASVTEFLTEYKFFNKWGSRDK
jgi:hypothetical protein